MSSTRLPGKVLLDLSGEPVLMRVVERVRQAKKVSDVIVATSVDSSDDVIFKFCRVRNIRVTRGALDDVLARYDLAASQSDADVIVRITSDCPLIDPHIIDECIGAFEEGGYDYISNCTNGPRTFPRGLDTEVFSRAALKKAHEEARETYEREHVTPYIWQNKSGAFSCGPAVTASPEYARQCRLTLDYPEDYTVIKHLYDVLFRDGGIQIPEVLSYLDAHPDIASINAGCEQKTL